MADNPTKNLTMREENKMELLSDENQKVAWKAMYFSINDLISKLSVDNCEEVSKALLQENIIWGRGIFCQSLMQAQFKSIQNTDLYAFVAAYINSHYPVVGHLLVTRCIVDIHRSFSEHEESRCFASLIFIAHLLNQNVVYDKLGVQIVLSFLHFYSETLTDMAVAFFNEYGPKISKVGETRINGISVKYRKILNRSYEPDEFNDIDFKVESINALLLLILRMDGDDPNEYLPLNLAAPDKQFMHVIYLNDNLDPQDHLNVYTFRDEICQKNEKLENTYYKEKAIKYYSIYANNPPDNYTRIDIGSNYVRGVCRWMFDNILLVITETIDQKSMDYLFQNAGTS